MIVPLTPASPPQHIEQVLADSRLQITRRTVREAVRDMGLKARVFDGMRMHRTARLWAQKASALYDAARDAGLWGDQ